MDMKSARAAIFSRIEREILPDAETRIKALQPFSVEGIPFGSKPTAKAFGPDGDLRFDIGLWDGTRFVPFEKPVQFPLDSSILGLVYPKELGTNLRNVYAHYTPVTRRLDRVEVHDYFYTSRTDDKTVREKALGLLAAAVARRYPAERVTTGVRYTRYAEQYLVITEIGAREFAAAGAAEAAALCGR